jgi:hypothetical protein
MGTVTSIIGLVAPLIGSILSAGPLGAILLGVVSIGALIGGIFLYNKFKGWQFANALNTEQTQAHQDSTHVIVDNQNQATGDAATISQGQADQDAAINSLPKKPTA